MGRSGSPLAPRPQGPGGPHLTGARPEAEAGRPRPTRARFAGAPVYLVDELQDLVVRLDVGGSPAVLTTPATYRALFRGPRR